MNENTRKAITALAVAAIWIALIATGHHNDESAMMMAGLFVMAVML